jgi:hypothetical protein
MHLAAHARGALGSKGRRRSGRVDPALKGALKSVAADEPIACSHVESALHPHSQQCPWQKNTAAQEQGDGHPHS